MSSFGDEEKSCGILRKIRRIAAQLIATSVANLLIIDAGLVLSMPAIIIPALTGIANDQNTIETLSMTVSQASWIGSIGYLIQPLGSVVGSLMTDKFGRRRSMILVNIPFAIGWLLLYRSNAIWKVFTGSAIVGFGIGLIDVPVVAFLGEICEPSTRGVLIAYSNIAETIGMFVIYVLNTLMPWRSVSFFCLIVPFITMIALYFIPETPQWLLEQGRTKDAEKSLCWLRGWTSLDSIAPEFDRMQQHSERFKSCGLSPNLNPKPVDSSLTLSEKIAEFKRKRTLKPFAIVLSLCFLAQFTGVLSMRPFIVQIFKAYESPIEPDQAAAAISFSDNIGTLVFICVIRFTGKRCLFLTMALGIFFSSLVISCYGFIYLPSGYNSFDLSNQTSHLENPDLAYIPVICLFLWSFFSYCGFLAIPWVLLSELFSFNARGLAVGAVAAFNYLLGFIGKKTYYNLEMALTMPGVSLFYCVITGAGLILMYFILPETEGRTLEDIELHFADDSKKLTNRQIQKTRAKTTPTIEIRLKQTKRKSNL